MLWGRKNTDVIALCGFMSSSGLTRRSVAGDTPVKPEYNKFPNWTIAKKARNCYAPRSFFTVIARIDLRRLRSKLGQQSVA